MCAELLWFFNSVNMQCEKPTSRIWKDVLLTLIQKAESFLPPSRDHLGHVDKLIVVQVDCFFAQLESQLFLKQMFVLKTEYFSLKVSYSLRHFIVLAHTAHGHWIQLEL